MQNIIWAFSRTPPESAAADAPFSVHQRMGRGTLNLTRVSPEPAEPSESPQPSPSTPPLHQPQPEESDEEVEKKGGPLSFVHGALCTAGFLLVLPSGALVARYAKVTGSARAFQLHGLLQFGLGSCRARLLLLIPHSLNWWHYPAGGSITGGMVAYLFMDNRHSSITHKVM
jgi:hypothetical protein